MSIAMLKDGVVTSDGSNELSNAQAVINGSNQTHRHCGRCR
jgi:hypothetical protein